VVVVVAAAERGPDVAPGEFGDAVLAGLDAIGMGIVGGCDMA